MADITKGIICSFGELKDRNGDPTQARVCPIGRENLVSRLITIPFFLRGQFGNLVIGTPIYYTTFIDETGVILGRMDGEWPGVIPGNVSIVNGDVKADSISLKTHIHGGVKSGGDKTGVAQ